MIIGLTHEITRFLSVVVVCVNRNTQKNYNTSVSGVDIDSKNIPRPIKQKEDALCCYQQAAGLDLNKLHIIIQKRTNSKHNYSNED